MKRATIYVGGMVIGWGVWLAVAVLAVAALIQTPRQTDQETLRLIAPTTRQQHDARPEINHGGSVAVVQADIAVQYRFGGIR